MGAAKLSTQSNKNAQTFNELATTITRRNRRDYSAKKGRDILGIQWSQGTRKFFKIIM